MSAASVVTVIAARLAEQEWIIERSLKSFIEIGDALTVVRNERLYRENYPTFETYCQSRWGFTPQHAGRLMIASSIALEMEPMGSIPNERQARELAKVPEPQREQVWRETLERTDGKPTAAAVREVAAPPAEPEAKPAEPEPAPRPAPRVAPRVEVSPEDAEAARRQQDIEAARRAAQTIVTDVLAVVVTVVTGSRLGENLITRPMVEELRKAIDLLEGEL